MHYIFVVNGRHDFVRAKDEIIAQADALDLSYEVYVTTGEGDATRYVNIYCDLNPKEEVCFVACGGAGTTNEVASGVVLKENKYLAIYKCGGTNDLLKYYPGRNFRSVEEIVNGERVKIDAMKVNDSYAINVINVGMDSMAANLASIYSAEGIKDPYRKGIMDSVLKYRFNNYKVYADGERLWNHRILLTTIANAKYCGGEFLCAPDAVIDDGLLDVCSIRRTSLVTFAILMKHYPDGSFMTNSFCRRRCKFRKAKHVELVSKDIFYACLDGEIIASTKFVIDVLDKAVNLILPRP